MIDIHIAKDEAEKKLCYHIRNLVFVQGQNVPAELDKDGLDEQAEHAIIFYDKEAVGCARIRYVKNDMKLERIAILLKMRGKGLGKKLMQFLIKYAEQKKVSAITLSSQACVEEFYKKLGFQTTGQPYEEIGIPHIKMYKEIN